MLQEAIAAADGSLQRVEAFHGAMARGPELLVASDRRVETLFAFLDGPIECDPPRGGQALQTPTEVILVDRSSAPQLVDDLGGADVLDPVDIRTCRAGDLRATLIGPAGAAPPSDWTGFEVRLALQVQLELAGQTQLAEVIGLPHRDAARRMGLLEALRESEPDALFVDAGSFVDGASAVRDNVLSLHRPTGFEALRRLDPAALVPGRSELAAGAATFVEEAGDLPYVATNWRSVDEALQLPGVVRRTVTTEAGPVEVAFLGAVDPAVSRWVPGLEAQGIWLDHPVSALQARADELRRSEDPPDLVIVLTSMSAEPLRDLQRRLHHVDIIVGDPGPGTDRTRRMEVRLRPPHDEDPLPALTLPLDGVGVATLEVDASGLARVVAEPRRITSDLPPSPWVLERVNAVRRAEYPRLDQPLLPARPESPTEPLDQATWEKVVCEAVLERSGADVALLPRLPAPPPLPGPQTELLVVDRLALLDVVEVHEVGGEHLTRLLDKAFQVVQVACGAPLGEKAPTVGGRPIDELRTYRVATTDRMQAEPGISGAIAEGRSTRLLDQPTVLTPTRADGPLTLRRATLDVLQDLRDDGVDPVDELSARSSADVTPLWMLRIARASFSVARFRGVDDEAYALIPETLATSPSSFTLTTDVDLSLAWSSRHFAWDLRNRTLYSQLSTDDDRQEPADDLRLSTSASLPGASIPTGPLGWIPYTEALLDSELTPVEAEDGTRNPRQADLSLTLGLSTTKGVLKTLRVGGFALRDLAVPDKSTEFGGRGELLIKVGFGPGLYWSAGADTFVYADTPDPDASDLRYKALFDTRVELPLARWLSGAVYAQGFVFRGRVPETSDVGASWTLGGALDLAGAFAL